MQTLRKKTSPLKYKNETTRFLGDGVSFKAKLIGILEVSEARGDRMCQEALSDLKMAIRAAGEHKQRITIHIALDGLRLRDEKTGDSLYHHPVHKISFIAQDMTDSRAFGYIFGSPDTGHRFFGIKTDKAASQVVIAMRDLFQVVFALKKKEIEIAKIHLEKTRFPTSPMFSETSGTSSKLQSLAQDKLSSDPKAGASASDAKSSGTAVADLVDLELELNSLQQGLNQMERITPSDPFGSKDDPFGDSFISYPKPILPPPPSSGRERSSRTSDSSSLFSPKTPHIGHSTDGTASDVLANKKDFNFSQDFNSSHEEPSSGDWFTPSAGNSLFEEPSSLQEATKDEKHERAKQEILSQFDVFTELDPLELKNPPKKALNDLVQNTTNNQTVSSQESMNVFATTFNLQQQKAPSNTNNNSNIFSNDPFGEDPFVKEDPFAEADFSKQDPFETELNNFDKFKFDSKKLDNLSSLLAKQISQTSPRTVTTSTSPRNVQFDTHFDQFEEKKTSKLTQLHENPSLDISSESESAPEPPPRPAATLVHIKPPPLPPKKQKKPLPRLPTVESHYDYMDKYETAPNSLDFVKNIEKSPPLPVPARKSKFETDFTIPPERPKKQINLQSSEEDYLTPIKFKEPEPVYQQPKKQSTELNLSAEGLDMTLSQLTLSGLNELAVKLNIPSSQLSNMTLAQLTSFLSNFMKSNNLVSVDTSKVATKESGDGTFQADFAANFNNLNAETYDRYAVFRELMQEEIKQTKIDTEPEQLQEEKQLQENNVNLNLTPIDEQNNSATDKYAALREIVDIELKQNENSEDIAEVEENSNDLENNENIINKENKFNIDEGEKELTPPKNTLIEYAAPLVDKIENQIISPLKSPKQSIVKSPIPNVVSEIIQTSTRLTSGSLSDVISGSSPEVDNTANSDNGKKALDATGESWAIFDQANIPTETVKEKPGIQSEEGVSPWSSDSKEFGNGSPPDWRGGNRPEHWSKRRRDQEGWWDTSAEPETQFCPSNRRSTDSYDDEYYECYDRPRRRRQGKWTGGGGQAAGGHSSSSRDVSPWEEEPCRRDSRESRESRESRPGGGSWGRHVRQQSFDRRRHTDSFDEDDDYEYDDEHGRFHWNERHSSRDSERDRHSTGSREHEPDLWKDERMEGRRHRRKRDAPSRDRWCCPDWDQAEHEKGTRYGRWAGTEPPIGKYRDRKPDARYYSRESQESPWEDEYQNEPEDAHSNYYLTAKSRNWKQRPSSASEMDRKTGEIKSRHYLGAGGSDTERDRRYKTTRRSRSRDSQYSEPPHRHKTEPTTSRLPHRTKMDALKKSENSKIELSNKKSSTLNRKKSKESPQQAEENLVSTFPRKSASNRTKSLFENDFVEPTPPIPPPVRTKFQFDNDFETSEIESPTANVNRSKTKSIKHQSLFEKDRFGELKGSARYQAKKSLFEDDFSPSNEKQSETILEDSISSIKEEKSAIEEEEEEDSFSTNACTAKPVTTNQPRKKILTKNRNNVRTDINLKKSESVNIFARESDPFDDDFFSGNDNVLSERRISRNTELRWTEDFEDFDTENKK